MTNLFQKFLFFQLALFCFIFTLLGIANQAKAESLSERLAGRILLQIEQNGEAWYVNPDTKLRYYLGRPQDAFNLMRSQGLGISNRDINKIPVGLQLFGGDDLDQDGFRKFLRMLWAQIIIKLIRIAMA